MKKFRKIMAVLVAAIMIVAMTVPAWAETSGTNSQGPDATDTITISVNTNKMNEDGKLEDKNSSNETHTAFRIFSTTKTDSGIGNTTNTGQNPSIDAQYVSVAAESWSGTTQYYTKTDTTPAEYIPITVASGDFEGKKAKLYKENPQNTKGIAYFLDDDSPWAFLASETASAGDDVTDFLTFTRAADESGWVVSWINSETTKNTEANAKKLAKVLEGYISKNGSDEYIVGPNSKVLTEDTDYYVISNTDPKNVTIGYYLIISTLGYNLVLATTDITITEKNTYPTVDKKIIGTSDDAAAVTAGTFGEKVETEAQIGDTVSFKITALIPDEANQGFELHDTMDKSLSLIMGTFSVKRISAIGTEAQVPQKEEGQDGRVNWTVQYKSANISINNPTTSQAGVTSSDTIGTDSFVVSFTKDYIDSLALQDSSNADKGDVKFEVTYDAVLNNGAILSTAELDEDNGKLNYNVNKVNLVYSNYTTPDIPVKVYTHELDIVKYYEDGSSNKVPLKGAVFKLYRDTVIDPDTEKWTTTDQDLNPLEAIHFTQDASTKEYRVKNLLNNEQVASSNPDDTLLKSEDGKYNIEGLDEGTYYLLEVDAPYGYNKLDQMIKIVVTPKKTNNIIDGTEVKQSTGASESEGKVTYQMAQGSANAGNASFGTAQQGGYYTSGGVSVLNKAGTLLPSTGGMGTTVLYIVGGMLVILAGAYLFFSRKRTA